MFSIRVLGKLVTKVGNNGNVYCSLLGGKVSAQQLLCMLTE